MKFFEKLSPLLQIEIAQSKQYFIMSDWKKYSKPSTESKPASPATTTPTASKNNNNGFKVATVVLSILLVAAVVTAAIFGMRSNDYENQTYKLHTNIEELNDVQLGLEEELAGLEANYETQVTENEGLQVTIEEKVQEIETLQSKIRKVRSQLKDSEANKAQMTERLVQLEELKAALENDVVNLREENAELAAAKDELNEVLVAREVEIQELTGQVTDLTANNQKMQNRLYQLAPAGYRAGNFAIDVETKKDKLTSKARQASEIKVKFDIPHVPAEAHGKAELYLVVTDVHGNAVASLPSSTVSVPAANQNLKVEATAIKEVDLKNTQSINMAFAPLDKMEAGEYNLMVYSDDGYLGATGFRLR